MSRPAYKRHNFGPDSERIECNLCGRAFRTISISHVRYRHGIDLDDYRERFPKAALTSEETRQRVSAAVSSHYELRGRHWTPERVRDSVKTLRNRGEPLNARAVFLSRKALYEAAYSFFGSWDNVLREAGINPEEVRLNQKWSRDRVLEQIRGYHAKGELSYGTRLCRRRPNLVLAASALFGSWREALKEAGMEALASPKTEWNRRKVVSRIRERAEKGKSLLAGKVHREDSALWKAAKRFYRAPWPILIRKLGYTYAGNEKWSRERITKDIRKLASEGQDLQAAGIYRDQRNLFAAAGRFFGSWRGAVTAAGIRAPLLAPGLESHREEYKMAHTSRDQEKFLVRTRRIQGRILALEKALAQKEDCSKILHLLAGSRGAMDNLMIEILEGHIRFHIADAEHTPASDRTKATEELISFVRGYLR